jgi:ribosomal protein S18 acetylase RimI-like enzyme
MSKRPLRHVVGRGLRVPGAVFLAVVAMAGYRRPSSEAEGRYVVTSTPLRVGLADSMGLCIAVDASETQGVWWWEPGASGCATRSTGPDVFHADDARVFRSTESNVVTVAFRLQLHSARPPSFIDVRLVVEQDRMRTLDSRAAVAVHRRQDLNVPWELPPPREAGDMTMTVRHATLADADPLADLMTELGYPTTAAQMTARLAAILADGDYRTFIASDGPTIAGAIGTRTGPLYEFDEPYGQIMVLVIAVGYRRRGVGRLLLEAAEAFFSERRARFAVVTSANRRSDAHAFYEKYGYAFDGRRYKKPLSA